jgi:hypothetical protein
MADTDPIRGINATRRLRRTTPSRTRQQPRPAPSEDEEEHDDDKPRGRGGRRGRKGRFIDERC